MKTSWIKGHDSDAATKEARKKEVRSYKNAFDELKEILERDYRKKASDRKYDGDWVHRQIAINEYNAVLDDILNLIDIKD